MKLVAVMPVRNEAWVLGLSARVALMWCDAICILNHASTDRTPEILNDLQTDYSGRVHVVSMPGEVWTEMQHRECLLELARAKEGTHVAMVDADEILTGNLLQDGAIPQWWRLQTFDGNHRMLELPGYNLRGGIYWYHANGVWGKRWFSLAFKDSPRLHWAGNKFHHREPHGVHFQSYRPIKQGDGGIMHLWGVSEKRLIAKHALYKIVERIRWPEKPVEEIDQMYSWAIHGAATYGTPATWQYGQVPSEWWKPYGPLLTYLDINAEPWQIEECWRLVKQHGHEKFIGLDLFGVV